MSSGQQERDAPVCDNPVNVKAAGIWLETEFPLRSTLRSRRGEEKWESRLACNAQLRKVHWYYLVGHIRESRLGVLATLFKGVHLEQNKSSLILPCFKDPLAPPCTNPRTTELLGRVSTYHPLSQRCLFSGASSCLLLMSSWYLLWTTCVSPKFVC